jgi:hypothetical protein
MFLFRMNNHQIGPMMMFANTAADFDEFGNSLSPTIEAPRISGNRPPGLSNVDHSRC